MAIDDQKMQEISKRYLDLPEDLQKALFSTQNSEAIFEIGKKNGILVDKIGELADETGLVMLGMTKPSEYIKNLASRLAIEPEKAKSVAEDINQKVFAPIRESLKKIHGITPPPAPVGAPPPLTVRGGGEGSGVIKRELPPLPPKPPMPPPTLPIEKKESKLPIKIIMPEIKEQGLKEPAIEEKIPPTSPILSGKIVEESKPQTVPDLFVRKIPTQEAPKTMDAKNALEKELSPPKPSNNEQKDPYKEPI